MKPINRNTYSRFISLVTALVVFIGILVVLGWVMDIKILRAIEYSYISMKFNTAVGFILSGISMFLCIKNFGKRWITLARVISFVVFMMGALTLSQEIFGIDIGIDQVLQYDYENKLNDDAYPGRMSNTAAFSFIVIGLYLFFF